MYQHITLVGNLGNDPELWHAPSGDPVTRFSVATSRPWTGQDGAAAGEDRLVSGVCVATTGRDL